MSTDNPYESPSTTAVDAGAAVPGTQQIVVDELSDDAIGNLGLTLKITRVTAVFAVFASLGAVWRIWTAFRFEVLSGALTAWQILFFLDCMFAPCWLLLAWMLWKYSQSLGQLRLNGIRHTEATIEEQAKLWLAIGLIVFLILVRVAIFWGISTTSAASQVG